MKKTAKQYIAAIDQNVDAYYADAIDYDTFGARQIELWDEIVAAGPRIQEAVLRVLRQRLPAVAGRSR